MALNLQAMREKMLNKENSTEYTSNTGNSNIFRFGDLKPGDEVRIRFIEDADKNNSFFWRERHTRTLRFDSLLLPDNNIMVKDTRVSVPAFNLRSNETGSDDLPQEYLYKSTEDVIQQKIKGFWIDGDKTSQALYNKFGKKVTYLFQGFIHSPGYESKLYRFVINKDLFNLLKSFINDSEIEDVPCDAQNGRDFILKVSEKTAVINGTTKKIKDYVTQSKWSSRITPLTQEELDYLNTNGAFDLKTYLPKRPSAEQEQIMFDMYNASYDGKPYDIKNWSSTFKPDNIWLDQQGNVKLREGERTQNIATELPQQTVAMNPLNVAMQEQVVQPVMQPVVQQPVMQQMVQPQPQVLVDSPVQVQVQQPVMQAQVQQTVTRAPSATQIAQPVTEQIQTTNVNDTLSSIMAKLNTNN